MTIQEARREVLKEMENDPDWISSVKEVAMVLLKIGEEPHFAWAKAIDFMAEGVYWAAKSCEEESEDA